MGGEQSVLRLLLAGSNRQRPLCRGVLGEYAFLQSVRTAEGGSAIDKTSLKRALALGCTDNSIDFGFTEVTSGRKAE